MSNMGKLKQIKFRIRWRGKKHYWGFIETPYGLSFAGIPQLRGLSIERAQQLSEQFTGYYDTQGEEIYENDEVLVSSGMFNQKSVRGRVCRNRGWVIQINEYVKIHLDALKDRDDINDLQITVVSNSEESMFIHQTDHSYNSAI